ncbi:hypothetical protein NF865_05770 [Thermococcus aggregans]|uniref:Uncharacterized protein n=1 Tax=Thermococcus aggregans TaxID=110163 RepID=A0A9E7SMQ6_THEAG|nr:hypothetical protein [Thermococcus aggregans]USS39880.1 hypothetical protein NF865_05770 [Thermococcus aggregans]
MSRKWVMALLITVLITGGLIVGVMNHLAGNEKGITKILGYDVYRIEGSGKYVIYYPLPNGSVKVLKRSKASGILPTFVKVPRHEWVKALSTGEQALYAPPTPLILYVTDDGKLGMKSITSSRIKLEGTEALDLKGDYSDQSTGSCPNGYIDFGGRYCLISTWDFYFESSAKTKTFDEWVSVFGLKIENNVAEKVDFDWDLVLSRSTYSYWTVGIDVGPFTVLSVSKGENFEGWSLQISYDSTSGITVHEDPWERYLNIRVEYIVTHAEVPAYDKLMGEYTEIEVVQTYPIMIHSTGSYTIEESASSGVYFKESSGSNPPQITKTPHIWRVPENTNWERDWISNTGVYIQAIYLRQVQRDDFTSKSSFTIPIGAAAGRYLSSVNPTLAKLANTIGITFGFHTFESAISIAEYDVELLPAKDCYSMYSVLGVNVEDKGVTVDVPVIFGIISDGMSPPLPCSPDGICVESVEQTPEKS